MNAFTLALWASDDRLDDRARVGCRRQKPRPPRDHLVCERALPQFRVKVTESVNPARALRTILSGAEVIPSRPKVQPIVLGKFGHHNPEPAFVRVEPSECTPRFYRWWVGATAETAVPVY